MGETTIRNTVQRQIIFEALQKLDTHPTVEEVYALVRKDYPTISKVTVYRNLRLLAENGLIGKVELPDESERYDRRADHHYHFKCQRCGALFDVDIEDPIAMDEAVAEKYGFQIDGHDVVFRGVCPDCLGVTYSEPEASTKPKAAVEQKPAGPEALAGPESLAEPETSAGLKALAGSQAPVGPKPPEPKPVKPKTVPGADGT